MERKFVNRVGAVWIMLGLIGWTGCLEEAEPEKVDVGSDVAGEVAAADDDSFCDDLEEEEERVECRRLWREGLELLTDEVHPTAACSDTWKCCWVAQGGCTEDASAHSTCQTSGQTNHCNDAGCRVTCNTSAGNCKCAS